MKIRPSAKKLAVDRLREEIETFNRYLSQNDPLSSKVAEEVISNRAISILEAAILFAPIQTMQEFGNLLASNIFHGFGYCLECGHKTRGAPICNKCEAKFFVKFRTLRQRPKYN